MATEANLNLRMRHAHGIHDFMVIRRIRNTCREFMTRDNSYISAWRQALYFYRYHVSDRMSVLYVGEDDIHRPIAYGLINYDKDLTPWVSGGVLPAYRGMGYGTQLFNFLCDTWQIPVFLEVLDSNIYAKKLYNGIGFVEVKRETSIREGKKGISRQETVITMKKDP